MDAAEDDDIRLQRAAGSYISEAISLLPKIFWKKPDAQGCKQVHRLVHIRDLERIVRLVEPFQEDPQLLDAHIKSLLPPLVDAYLEYLQVKSRLQATSNAVTTSNAICRILYTFCKVRGEKVVTGFLNNEPRHLEPILSEFEWGQPTDQHAEEQQHQLMSWEERYVLLLWLSHLMLTPFDLSTISSDPSTKDSIVDSNLRIPQALPDITKRALRICLMHIDSATKERDAAGTLLVRLIIRPDMRKLGLLDAVLRWSMMSLSSAGDGLTNIHKYLGLLSFLYRLVASATTEEIGSFLAEIYRSCFSVVNEDGLVAIRSSAVARKLVIKILRTVVVHCLKTGGSIGSLDIDTTLEDVIDYLLQALADGDTPVRYAASKALSVITLKLDPEMTVEVVEAILGSLNEDVLWAGSSRNLDAVNPLRWHGLTLTLSHLLYRRAPSTKLLPDIINALLLALTFEQRSSTGTSIGTNVRDAANFGIWALSRRYTTKELLAVQIKHVRAAQTAHHSVSLPQTLATELVVAACLDPAGNVRRGSSAALQELIGRHPDTIVEGIPLVQTVDFHAVGLREKAICGVAVGAAQLSQLYWDALFAGFLGWRGVGALDTPSRLSIATAVAHFSSFQQFGTVESMVGQMIDRLKKLPRREVDERHGILMALSQLISRNESQADWQASPKTESRLSGSISRSPQELSKLQLWNIFTAISVPQEKDFTSKILRPELTAAAVCSLLSALCSLSILLRDVSHSWIEPPIEEITKLLDLCLARGEESVLQLVPHAVEKVSLLNSQEKRDEIARNWVNTLVNASSYTVSKGPGLTIAIGAIYRTLTDSKDGGIRDKILDTLALRCTPKVEVGDRTVALQSLRLLFTDIANSTDDLRVSRITKISNTLLTALNDYTINERGDVGSLVRLEALSALEDAWNCGLLSLDEEEPKLHAAAVRLSVEKLDKVRAKAAHCLEVSGKEHFERAAIGIATGVSSYAYFLETLRLLSGAASETLRVAVLEGYISSAGLGSESVVKASRSALVDTLCFIAETSTSAALYGSGSPRQNLVDIVSTLTDILSSSLDTDRILLPVLEVIAFLFDARIMQCLIGTPYKWRNLLSLTQKSHYKTNNMQKLHLALEVYRGLAEVEVDGVKQLVTAKVASMLAHPFPKVRLGAAETLFMITGMAELKRYDWTRPVKDLKPAIDGIKEGIATNGGSSVAEK